MRLFVALEPPEQVKTELSTALQQLKTHSIAGINWVKPENLHLTLLFIGEVPDHQARGIGNCLETRLQDFAPALLTTEGLELFPARFPRLLWLKLSATGQSLVKLNRMLLGDLRQLGIGPDPKALKLHITLGRIKSPQTPDFERRALSYPINKDSLRWDTVSLYRSTLKPEGPVYNVLQQYYL